MEAKPNFHFYAICRMRGIPSFAVVGCVGRAPLVHFERCPIGHGELLPSVAVLLNSKSRKDAAKRTLQDSIGHGTDRTQVPAAKRWHVRHCPLCHRYCLLENAMTHDVFENVGPPL